MGNCVSQFENVPQEAIWEDGQRTYGELIGQQHLTLKTKLPATQMNNNSMYMSLQGSLHSAASANPLAQSNRPIDATVIQYQWQRQNKQAAQANPQPSVAAPLTIDEHRERLQFNSRFYDSLDLSEYVYEQPSEELKRSYYDTEYKEVENRRGVKYLGQWKAGLPHGKGILSSNVERYIGWFANGLKHFHGREVYADEVYQGGFEYGKRRGKGVRYTTKLIEIGQFDNQLKEGQIVYSDGSKYKGTVVNKLRKGDGCRFMWPDGTVYEGCFDNDKINGKGKMVYPNGRQYDGQFLDEKMHGRGKYYWKKDTPDEKIYDGEYQNGLKHGTGKYIWDKARSYYYEGSFELGKPHGKGTIVDQNGQRVAEFHFGKQLRG